MDEAADWEAAFGSRRIVRAPVAVPSTWYALTTLAWYPGGTCRGFPISNSRLSSKRSYSGLNACLPERLPGAAGTLPSQILHLPLLQQHLNALHMQDLHGGSRSCA